MSNEQKIAAAVDELHDARKRNREAVRFDSAHEMRALLDDWNTRWNGVPKDREVTTALLMMLNVQCAELILRMRNSQEKV